MKIEIHGRALLAMDYLRPGEREAIQSALAVLSADPGAGRGRLKALGRIPSGEIFALPISHDLQVILRRAGSPDQLEVIEVVRPEIIRSYFESAA